ncbi:DUF5131 family protein [Mycobacterium phage Panchino]|uniref:Phage Gp37/Gp68 family protein n=1 Tax=Mycobacterium phage Panchino TaxID=1821537 RepID=A0A142K7I8_9CAUD|nr:DUF5131 family protein [Mycobacterium phage Panchino]AMS02071.1 hypothetical protein SEA_PANCHINO_53 [Mycobacterium phage Panchino]
MSDHTGIEWTDATWNPATGCTKVSAGCDNCYAEKIAHRFAGTSAYPNGFEVTLRPERLDWPLRKRKPLRIFVNSMSDLFHDQVPDEYIAKVFAVMAAARHHTFQVLTKRHGRMRSLLSSEAFRDGVAEYAQQHADPTRGGSIPTGPWDGPEWWPLWNVWLGVSTENQKWADVRIPALLDTPAAVRFISAEPLLGPIDLSRFLRPTKCSQCGHGWRAAACGPTHAVLAADPGLHWVIVGGESGPGARPMHPAWARSLRDQCTAADVPFLFKQWGEWGTAAPMDPHGRLDFRGGVVMTDDGNVYQPGDLDWPDGPRRGEAHRADFPHHHPTYLYRVGKKRTGRELDGRTWDQYPEAVTHA